MIFTLEGIYKIFKSDYNLKDVDLHLLPPTHDELKNKNLKFTIWVTI